MHSFQVRVARIQQIEKDILRIRQLLQSQAVEAEVSEQIFAFFLLWYVSFSKKTPELCE